MIQSSYSKSEHSSVILVIWAIRQHQLICRSDKNSFYFGQIHSFMFIVLFIVLMIKKMCVRYHLCICPLFMHLNFFLWTCVNTFPAQTIHGPIATSSVKDPQAQSIWFSQEFEDSKSWKNKILQKIILSPEIRNLKN